VSVNAIFRQRWRGSFSFHSLRPISGLLYFAGGAGGGTGPPLSVNESFSATTKKWTTLKSMPLAVIGPGSAAVSNLLYCFGGSNNGGLFLGTVYNNVQIYRP
jgi:hypothetical protein